MRKCTFIRKYNIFSEESAHRRRISDILLLLPENSASASVLDKTIQKRVKFKHCLCVLNGLKTYRVTLELECRQVIAKLSHQDAHKPTFRCFHPSRCILIIQSENHLLLNCKLDNYQSPPTRPFLQCKSRRWCFISLFPL